MKYLVFEKEKIMRKRLSAGARKTVRTAAVFAVAFAVTFAGGARMAHAEIDRVISAEEWRALYPEIVESMESNSDNNYRISYLDEDPYLTNVYEGYGFAIDYTSAVGHTYTLEDVHNTQRPHPLANCLTCKSPNFTKLVNDLGEEVYSYDFEETWAQLDESISCYNCHANHEANNGELVVTHQYIADAVGEDIAGINPATMACGQCRIEDYFDPDNKATRSPIHGLEGITPESVLDYYNEIGFTDWVQESTGTHMLKAQHPEFETFLGGKHAAFLSCADCHMAIVSKEDGTTYRSHKWESPLANEAILETCAKCHQGTDMAEFVHGIQEEITAKEREVGEALSELKDTLSAAVEEGKLSEQELDEVRQLHREAQWFWDYCYVENSEGAHNSELANRCLDTSAQKIAEAMGKLKA